ncbi:hypothetical protein PR048_010044 [Dryococelus australis]|uniref:Uncharacterized protein n=1 Tax=Dryococelus australis TaxID=614101 RepID=A0ABQ9I1L7_9NEOP|nr:hypothetical protein PR048_010044 [Dryococelus australis]
MTQHTGKISRKYFGIRFNRAAPPKLTVVRWEKKPIETCSIKDRPRSGRSTRAETCAEIAASVEQLNVPLGTLRCRMPDDLVFKVCGPSFNNEWVIACALLLEAFDTRPYFFRTC